MSAKPSGVPVTFVNRFAVTAPADEFERVFEETSRFMARQPGFLRHTLLRDTGDDGAYVNIALWTSEEAFRRAVGHEDFGPHAAALRALCTSEPGLYHTRQHREPAVPGAASPQ